MNLLPQVVHHNCCGQSARCTGWTVADRQPACFRPM